MKDMFLNIDLRYIVVVAYLIIVVIYIFATHKNKESRLRAITKALLMPLLALIYILFARHFNILVVLALIFGWLGDILPLPFPGAIPFGIGHLLYAFVIASLTTFSLVSPVEYIVTILFFLVTVLSVYNYLRPHIKKTAMNIMVIGYMILISAMGILSVLLFLSNLKKVGLSLPYLFIALGGLFFVVSDSVLSQRLFVKDAVPKHVTVIVTYLLAQSLLTLGLILI